MKRINHISISIGTALILFNVGRTSAHSTQSLPIESTSHRIKVRQIYTSQIGVREKGSNSGPDVEKYLRYVRLTKGNPWCAAFVCWVFGQAGVGNPRTGWSPGLFPEDKVIWNRITESGKLKTERVHKIVESGKLKTESVHKIVESGKLKTESVHRHAYPFSSTSYFIPHSSYFIPPSSYFIPPSSLLPQPGDVFGLFFPEKARIAHVGFVDQWDGTWMISVEGNTNVSGSREGDGVYRKRRLVRTVWKVARYVGR